jgi:hypothetical protein
MLPIQKPLPKMSDLPAMPTALPVFGAAVAGPALLITAVMTGDKLSGWSRAALGLIGLVTIGASVKAMSEEQNAAQSTDLVRNLLIGMEVEREHTSDPKVAMQIALDHLKEHSDYYDRMKAAGL